MRKIVEIKFGSHLYGTNTENSDLDLKAIYLPTKEEILTGKYQKTIIHQRGKQAGEKNTKDDVDIEIFSLDRFVELLLEGQTIALDMLFSTEANMTEEGLRISTTSDGKIWQAIVANKDKFLSKDVTAFIGYARRQAGKYGVKGSRVAAVRQVLDFLKKLHPHSKLGEHEVQLLSLIESTKQYVSMEKTSLIEIVQLPVHKEGPLSNYLSCCDRKVQFTQKVGEAIKIYQRVFDQYGARALQAESNSGVDWKSLSHAIRVNSEAVELLTTGKITFPLPNRDLILAIKQGKLPYKEVAEMIEGGLINLEQAKNVSSLPDKPDVAWADFFVRQIYGLVLVNS